MNYLVSRFDCNINNMEIFKNVKYKLNENKCNYTIFGKTNEVPIVVNFSKYHKNLLKIDYGSNKYFMLLPTKICDVCFFKISHLNTNFYVTVSSKIIICTDKGNILEEEVENVTYSHYEVMGNILLIYFLGKRNYVVVIQNQEVKIAMFYDEFNQTETEKLFMCRLNDSLNHGRVVEVKNSSFKKYLVYLDDNNLNLQPRFLCFVFLDCLLAENFKYCNELLLEEIKQKEAENIKNFFPEFDFYFELETNVFALIKKDALAGIFNFETNNLKITNIIPVGLQLV